MTSKVGEGTWQQGFEAGESSIEADWQAALDDVLPAWIRLGPQSVAEYIQHLQGEIEHRRGPKP